MLQLSLNKVSPIPSPRQSFDCHASCLKHYLFVVIYLVHHFGSLLISFDQI